MSHAEELLERLGALDVKLERDGNQLRINAPKGILSPELKRELSKHKAELLALLESPRGGIRPVPANAVVPLTDCQERIWALVEGQANSDVYNLPIAHRLRGDLQTTVLEKSLDEIQRRHSILRTRFLTINGQPCQQVVEVAAFKLEITDFCDLEGIEQSAAVEERLAAEIQRPFDLERDPLWRCALLRLAAEDHLLVFTVHHLVFDLFSKTIFLRELAASYSGEDLPELAIDYRDYACWQQSEGPQLRVDRQLGYWQRQLDGSICELLLPTDHPRPAATTMAGRSQTFRVPTPVTQRLDELNRATRCSMYMTLLAAFHALLHRYTGQTDQIICSPFACRSNTSVEALIGYFNNILPIRTSLDGDPTFRVLLGRVRRATIEASEHR